jgi:ankyrin repeat protein
LARRETTVQVLIEHGANIKSKDSNGRMPLFWATSNRRETIIKLLLATGRIDVNSVDRLGLTTLALAAQNG